jgi:hypothetical protein
VSGLRRQAWRVFAPLRNALAATLARVALVMPWSCMYRLIFMPKKWVVRNSPACPYQSGSPETDGSSENAPRGCLSSPIAIATSASPSLIALAAMAREVAPVAQPVKTARPGTPVWPSRPTMPSGFLTSIDPA